MFQFFATRCLHLIMIQRQIKIGILLIDHFGNEFASCY